MPGFDLQNFPGGILGAVAAMRNPAFRQNANQAGIMMPGADLQNFPGGILGAVQAAHAPQYSPPQVSSDQFGAMNPSMGMGGPGPSGYGTQPSLVSTRTFAGQPQIPPAPPRDTGTAGFNPLAGQGGGGIVGGLTPQFLQQSGMAQHLGQQGYWTPSRVNRAQVSQNWSQAHALNPYNMNHPNQGPEGSFQPVHPVVNLLHSLRGLGVLQ